MGVVQAQIQTVEEIYGDLRTDLDRCGGPTADRGDLSGAASVALPA
jgi:hypothetical protein